MKEKNINIWKHKLDWVASKGGMAFLNTHPDFMNFNGEMPMVLATAVVVDDSLPHQPPGPWG